MAVKEQDVELIVRQILDQMSGSTAGAAPAAKASGTGIPSTAHVAMLTELEKFEIKEFPMPEVGDDDILVKVEGCGVCGTDAHEFKRDPFSLIPVALGHEGTGEIVKMGKNVKKDSAGKDLHLGDKVVTCMIFKDNPDITMFDLNKQNVGGADVYGLLPDDDIHLNGWFSDYILVRGGSTVFNVSDLDLDSRILIEPCAVLVHAVERAKTTGILRFNSRVVVQGCGPIGLICIAVLRTMGIENITAVDGNQARLDFALRMGATKTVNFMEHKGIEELTKAVEDSFDGHLADFAFQCTGNPKAHANIYKFIRNGGGLCELGFFINGGDAQINPHFDLCSKEITLVGSWVYTLRDYATTFDFLKRAKGIGLPMADLITDKYPLEEINEALKKNLEMTGLKIAVVNKQGIRKGQIMENLTTRDNQEAVGLLEVFGLVCAFLAADAGCKAANVHLQVFDKNKPANADALPVPLLVTIKFRGSIADVEEAMRAAEAVAAAHTGIVSKYIIPRPTADTEKMLTVSALDKN